MAEDGDVSARTGSSTSTGDRHSWRNAADEWRTNWRVGVAAFIGTGLSFVAFQSVSSLFVLPLQKEFGWSRAEVAYAYNASIAIALCAPFVGRMIDRFGARGIMLVGMTLLAAVYFGLAAMNGTPLMFYVLSGLAGVIGLSTSGLTCARVISQAFVRSRGLSLAIARSGLSLATALLPVLLYAVILRYGWRGAYVVQGLLILAVALPVACFWIPRARTRVERDRPLERTPPQKWWYHLRERRVWLLCLGAGLGYAPATSIMAHLQPLLVSKGVDSTDAAALVGLTGVASLIGALVTGGLVDRFWAPGIAFVFACGSAAGTFLLATNATADGLIALASIMLIGLGLGAEIDVVAYLVARYFGLQAFSTVFGFVMFALTICGATGASAMGIVFDKFGNYDPMLYVLATSFVVAGCLYMLLGRYPCEHGDGHYAA